MTGGSTSAVFGESLRSAEGRSRGEEGGQLRSQQLSGDRVDKITDTSCFNKFPPAGVKRYVCLVLIMVYLACESLLY